MASFIDLLMNISKPLGPPFGPSTPPSESEVLDAYPDYKDQRHILRYGNVNPNPFRWGEGWGWADPENEILSTDVANLMKWFGLYSDDHPNQLLPLVPPSQMGSLLQRFL